MHDSPGTTWPSYPNGRPDTKTNRSTTMIEDMTLKLYFKEISKYPLLESEEEKDLISRAQSGEKKAREELIQSNLRLVVNIAKKYIHCGIPLSDLIAEGNIGLLCALDRFKLSAGCRFSTYATFWIKHTICHALTEKNGLVRIPTYMRKILSDCKRKNEHFLRESGHMPPVREMVKLLDIPDSQEKIVETAFGTNFAMEGMQSLQNLQDQDGIEDRSVRDSINRVFDRSEVEWILEKLKTIEPKRAQIIKMRYGLDGTPTLTLKEIASELRLTKERIRQLEKETLRLLKECLESRDGGELKWRPVAAFNS